MPILNWTASASEEVAKSLSKSWQLISERFLGFVDFRKQVARITIEMKGTDPLVSWDGSDPKQFSAVILAVGFGLEGTGKPEESYWSNDDLESEFGPDENVLVSGYGDGALTDLMRLCVTDFRQDEMIDMLAHQAGMESVIDRLLQIEQQAIGRSDEWLTGEYETIHAPALQALLAARRRPERTVSLVGRSPWRYSAKSFPLNRFIVSQLERVPAFTPLKNGPIVSVSEAANSANRVQYSVTFADGAVRNYDRIVRRHGPAPALEFDFPVIWKLCDPLRMRWADTAHQDDVTREPIWPSGYWEGCKGYTASKSMTEVDRAPAVSMIDLISRTMANPKYKDDLSRLDQHWKLEAVIGKQTVIIVVGSKVVTELLDRPVAELLREVIDKEGGQTPYHRAVVICDVAWFENETLFSNVPFISVGGPGGNNLTKWLLDPARKHPDRHDWPMGEGSKGFFRKVSARCPQVALYGNTATRTRRAVEVYLEKQEGLKSFLDMCWGR